MKNAISPDTPATLATLATQARQAIMKPAEPAPVAAPWGEAENEAAPDTLATLATPDPAPSAGALVLVCCCDCRHFRPDTIGSGQGIGQCAIGDPTLPSDQPHMDRQQAPAGERIRRYTIRTRPALWPRAERRCPGFEGLE